MGVPIDIALPGQTKADALALPLAQPLDLSGESARIVDEKLGGRLKQLAASGEFRGDRGEALLLHTDGDRVVLAGLGKRADLDLDAFRTAAAVTAQALARVGGTLGWLLDESLPASLPDQARALVEGTVIGGYTPGRWKTQDTEKLPRRIERIVIAHAETQELRDGGRACGVARRANEQRTRSREHAAERAQPPHAGRARAGARGRARPPEGGRARACATSTSSGWARSLRSAAAAATSRA